MLNFSETQLLANFSWVWKRKIIDNCFLNWCRKMRVKNVQHSLRILGFALPPFIFISSFVHPTLDSGFQRSLSCIAPKGVKQRRSRECEEGDSRTGLACGLVCVLTLTRNMDGTHLRVHTSQPQVTANAASAGTPNLASNPRTKVTNLDLRQ